MGIRREVGKNDQEMKNILHTISILRFIIII